MSDSPSPPPAPDPVASASAQGAANVETARQQGIMGNPNVNTPYGNQQVSFNPVTGQPTVNQTLAPAQQGILNSQNQISQGLLDTGQTALSRAQQGLSQPFDLSSVNDIYDKAYSAQTSRLDPQWQTAQAQQETQLRNQGLAPGGEAYDNAMRVFNQGKNDAYQQATNSAISTMPQTYQLADAAYTQPLNIVNALRSGSQVQSPQFQAYNGANVSPTNTLGAQQMAYQGQQNAYNAQVGANNANTQGLASVAGAGLGAWGTAASMGMMAF